MRGIVCFNATSLFCIAHSQALTNLLHCRGNRDDLKRIFGILASSWLSHYFGTMKKINLLLCFALSLLLFACNKKKDLDISFELTSSAPIVAGTGILTKVGLGMAINHGVPAGQTTWKYQVTTDTEYRPVELIFNIQNMQLSSAGSINAILFVNGEKKNEAAFTTVDQGNNTFVASGSPLRVTIE